MTATRRRRRGPQAVRPRHREAVRRERAGPHRPLPRAREDRPGRDGRRLRGDRRAARPQARAQGAAPGQRRRRRPAAPACCARPRRWPACATTTSSSCTTSAPTTRAPSASRCSSPWSWSRASPSTCGCGPPRAAWQDVLAVFLQAGRALAAAHAAGVLHRDFKPENVLVDASGRARVLDFGLARALASAAAGEGEADPGDSLSEPLTRTGSILGTPAYMAPEQLRGEKTDARADQFSFCVALYEGLYGERPFTAVPRFAAVRVTHVPKDSRIPDGLRRVVLRGLSNDPAQRWPGMDALLLAAAPPAVRRRWIIAAAALAGCMGSGSARGGSPACRRRSTPSTSSSSRPALAAAQPREPRPRPRRARAVVAPRAAPRRRPPAAPRRRRPDDRGAGPASRRRSRARRRRPGAAPPGARAADHPRRDRRARGHRGRLHRRGRAVDRRRRSACAGSRSTARALPPDVDGRPGDRGRTSARRSPCSTPVAEPRRPHRAAPRSRGPAVPRAHAADRARRPGHRGRVDAGRRARGGRQRRQRARVGPPRPPARDHDGRRGQPVGPRVEPRRRAPAGRRRRPPRAGVPPRRRRAGAQRLLRGHTAPVVAIAWHPGGDRVATVASDGTARVWSLVPAARVRFDHPPAVQALAWSPDGRHLASAGDDGRIHLFDTTADPTARRSSSATRAAPCRSRGPARRPAWPAPAATPACACGRTAASCCTCWRPGTAAARTRSRSRGAIPRACSRPATRSACCGGARRGRSAGGARPARPAVAPRVRSRRRGGRDRHGRPARPTAGASTGARARGARGVRIGGGVNDLAWCGPDVALAREDRRVEVHREGRPAASSLSGPRRGHQRRVRRPRRGGRGRPRRRAGPAVVAVGVARTSRRTSCAATPRRSRSSPSPPRATSWRPPTTAGGSTCGRTSEPRWAEALAAATTVCLTSSQREALLGESPEVAARSAAECRGPAAAAAH
jgi:hypothetical protein